MAQYNGLPVYNIGIKDDLDEKTGIEFISCVDYPAIEENFIALSKEPLKFQLNQDRQILSGPILIPDKMIYRYDERMGEYYVKFSKEVIERMVRKFQTQAKTININYQHQENSQVNGAVVQEIWLTGKQDKSKDLGFDLPEGSAFVCVHIGDSKFWNEEIKTKKVMGFSIEGFLDMAMSIIKQDKNMDVKFITAKTDNGVEVKVDGESFAVGAEIYTEENGTRTPAPDGEHILENGMMLTVAGGKITEVKEPEEALTEEETEMLKKAVGPMIEKALSEQSSKYESQIAELKAKLEAIPAAQSKTEKTDKTDKKLSVKETLSTKLSILRKKSSEITKAKEVTK